MKRRLSALFCRAVAAGVLLSMVAPCEGVGQTVDSAYEIGTWRGFRPSAVTHTFDDNHTNQLGFAVPLFDEFGYRLTLFAITNVSWSPIDYPGLSDAAERGHEVASHTVTHPRLNELTEAQQQIELGDSKAAIASEVEPPPGMTLAYPFCVMGNREITEEHYIAARGCQGAIEAPTPADMLNISSIIVGSEGNVQTANDLNARAESAAQSGGWAVFLTHGIDNDGGWSPVSSDELRAHVEYLAENDHKFWVETFGNVVRFIRERNAASVEEVSVSDNAIVVQVSDTLDNAVYNVPISIRRALPDGWPQATVAQNGEAVPCQRVETADGPAVMFDVVPDGGDVVLTRSSSTGIETGSAEHPGRTHVLRTREGLPEPGVTSYGANSVRSIASAIIR